MKLPPWLPLALLGALAIAIGVAAYQANEARIARAELGRQEEARRLKLAGIQQAHGVEVADLRARENLAQRRLGEALKSAGVKGTTIVTVAGSTGPVPVGGNGQASAPHAATAPSAPAPLPGAEGRACLLWEGEQGEIRVSGAAARTEAGNIAIDAQADAYAADRHLFGGPLHLDAKYLSPQASGPRGADWGIGIAAVGGRDGFLLGPAVALPTLDLWLFRLDTTVGVVAGHGDWAATSTVLGRRR